MWLLIHATSTIEYCAPFSEEVNPSCQKQLHNEYIICLSFNSWRVTQSRRLPENLVDLFTPIQLIYSAKNDDESMWIALPPIPHQTVTTVRTTQSWFTRVINSCMSTSLLRSVIAWDGVSADGLRVAAFFNSKMTFWGSDRNRMVTLQSQTAEYMAIQQVWLKGWCSDDRRHQYAQW